MKNKELFTKLSKLRGFNTDEYPFHVPNYMDWNTLMPIAVTHGVSPVFDTVLGHHEACLNLNTDNNEAIYDMVKFDHVPQIAIVKCLIAKLEGEK